MEANPLQVGNRIKKIRLENGLTMEEFGIKFNTSKGTVNNWEKGRNKPNKENLKAISDLGNISVDELLYGTTNEANQVLNALKKLRENISLQLEEAEIELELAKKRDWNPDDEVYATGKKNGLESSLMWIDAAIGFENTETKKLPTAISSRNKYL